AARRAETWRREADRRHRRMLVVTGLACAALSVVAAIAVYALVQRSHARHQAALAETRRRVAVHAKLDAQRQARISRHKTRLLRIANAKEKKTEGALAQQTKTAEQETAHADHETKDANEERNKS